MELIKSARRHGTLVSEIIYILLNVGLAAALLAVVNLFPGIPVLGYLLVSLSKWRVFAVRPRYWWDNFQTNLLDLLLGISVVVLLWQAKDVFALQIAISVLYVLWLVVLKPMSSQRAVLIQAAVAQFVAISALFAVMYEAPSWVLVVSMWVIGYIAARHSLNALDEEEANLLGLVWGLIVAELGWLAYHWTVAYPLVLTGSVLKIPLIAVIVTLLSYFSVMAYTMAVKGKLTVRTIGWPAFFSGSIILVMLLFFSGYHGSFS